MNVRLITNISYASLLPPGTDRGVRMNVAAVLLYDDDLAIFSDTPVPNIRGCGVDPAWSVFDYHPQIASALEYRTDPRLPWGVVTGDSGRELPLGAGDLLEWPDGTRLSLDVEDHQRPIDILDVADGFPAVWPVLARKAAEYWQAPFMPGLTHGPPAQMGPRAEAMARR